MKAQSSEFIGLARANPPASSQKKYAHLPCTAECRQTATASGRLEYPGVFRDHRQKLFWQTARPWPLENEKEARGCTKTPMETTDAVGFRQFNEKTGPRRPGQRAVRGQKS